MTLSEYCLRSKARLLEAGVECADPMLHLKQIAELALGLDTAKIYLKWESTLQPREIEALDGVLTRRLNGEPLQYIAGYEWFWDAKFRVEPGVLIPRRETELIVEILLKEGRGPRKIVELGAGSGNIGISVLRERPDWQWFAAEVNPATWPALEANLDTLLPKGHAYHLWKDDFFACALREAPYDWLVSNPPYVPSGDIPGLSREVRGEPSQALDGGADGLDCLRRLVDSAPRLLKSGGRVLFEIGSEQGEACEALLKQGGLDAVEVRLDYSGLPRLAMGTWYA